MDVDTKSDLCGMLGIGIKFVNGWNVAHGQHKASVGVQMQIVCFVGTKKDINRFGSQDFAGEERCVQRPGAYQRNERVVLGFPPAGVLAQDTKWYTDGLAAIFLDQKSNISGRSGNRTTTGCGRSAGLRA